MSELTMIATVDRIAEHCSQHNITSFAVVFHGGEPLLAGKEKIRKFVELARSRVDSNTELHFSIQTNGVLLSDDWCELLSSLGIRVGISIDGPIATHDLHRLDHRGRGSYHRTIAGWRNAVRYNLEPSLLSVIDLSISPLDCYEHIASLEPTKCDLLLPEATHDGPPTAPNSTSSTPYADWLLAFFEIWTRANAPFRVVTFEHLARKVLGSSNSFDALSSGRNGILVIETNGAIEPIDVLKACKSGLTKTKYDVMQHSFDEAYEDSMIRLYALSNENLPEHCRSCALHSLCAGGYLPHRFSSVNGFDNPSVYCRDLKKLITTIQNYVIDALPKEVIATADIRRLYYDEGIVRLGGVS